MYPFLSKLSFGFLLVFFQIFFGFKSSCAAFFEKCISTVEYIYPKENQVIFYQNLRLSWQNRKDIAIQRLQISSHKDFSDILIDTIVEGFTFDIESLEKNKEFYWSITDAADENVKPYIGDYSFFKTTSLHLQYPENILSLNFIPVHTGNQQLLFIDNPELLSYSISIFSFEENIRKLDRVTCSSYQCVPIYKLPKGKYKLKIHFTEKEDNHTSEILLTQNE